MDADKEKRIREILDWMRTEGVAIAGVPDSYEGETDDAINGLLDATANKIAALLHETPKNYTFTVVEEAYIKNALKKHYGKEGIDEWGAVCDSILEKLKVGVVTETPVTDTDGLVENPHVHKRFSRVRQSECFYPERCCNDWCEQEHGPCKARYYECADDCPACAFDEGAAKQKAACDEVQEIERIQMTEYFNEVKAEAVAAAVKARTQVVIDAINNYAEGKCSLERLAEDIGINFYELHAAMMKYENGLWYGKDNS